MLQQSGATDPRVRDAFETAANDDTAALSRDVVEWIAPRLAPTERAIVEFAERRARRQVGPSLTEEASQESGTGTGTGTGTGGSQGSGSSVRSCSR